MARTSKRQQFDALIDKAIPPNGTMLKSSNVTITPVPEPVSLASDRGKMYTFHPQPARNVVAVVRTGLRVFSRIELPTEEARVLWAKLEQQGFERF